MYLSERQIGIQVFFLQPYDIDSYELDIQMNISYFTIAKLYEIK